MGRLESHLSELGGGEGLDDFLDPIASSTILAKLFSVFAVTVIRYKSLH